MKGRKDDWPRDAIWRRRGWIGTRRQLGEAARRRCLRRVKAFVPRASQKTKTKLVLIFFEESV